MCDKIRELLLEYDKATKHNLSSAELFRNMNVELKEMIRNKPSKILPYADEDLVLLLFEYGNFEIPFARKFHKYPNSLSMGLTCFLNVLSNNINDVLYGMLISGSPEEHWKTINSIFKHSKPNEEINVCQLAPKIIHHYEKINTKKSESLAHERNWSLKCLFLIATKYI